MSALKYLPELLEANVIDKDTAERIRVHYRNKQLDKTNRLFVVFGILGALLVGLGIILIIAHNWDELSVSLKAGLSFVPLVVGQLVCAFVILRKYDSIAWREGSAVFVALAVGAAMALISQIYNIPGNFSSFMLTWMILVIPVIYIMKGAVTSLLYICGVTVYGIDAEYTNPLQGDHFFWLLIFAVLPFYFNLIRKKPESNFTILHNWFVPLAITILLGSVAITFDAWMYPAYASLFGLFLLTGNLRPFDYDNGLRNGFQVLGFLGTLVVSILLTFSGNWKVIHSGDLIRPGLVSSPEFLTFLAISVIALALAYYEHRSKLLTRVPLLELFFVLFAITFVIGLYSKVAVVLMNIYVLALGIWIVREGERRNHLGILNLGLAVISVLALSRFFDSEITFIVRGLIFLGVGTGFFFANYRMIKKRKADA